MLVIITTLILSIIFHLGFLQYMGLFLVLLLVMGLVGMIVERIAK